MNTRKNILAMPLYILKGKTYHHSKMVIISITTKQTPLTASNEDVEGYDVKAIITIKVRNEEKNLDMSGYCGV